MTDKEFQELADLVASRAKTFTQMAKTDEKLNRPGT